MLRRFFRRKPQLTPGQAAGEKAGLLYDSGLNCAQAVLQATTGIDEPRMMAMCDAFGKGIGGAKCLCGAVSGGVMALGLSGCGGQAGQLVELFKARYKCTCCKGLTAAYRWGSRAHYANCRQITVHAASLVEQLVREN